MKNKKWLIWMSAVLIVLAVWITAFHAMPGFHHFFDYMSVRTEAACYYFDADTHEVTGQGVVSLKGRGLLQEEFWGALSVPEYTNPEDHKMTGMGLSESNGFWRVMCTEVYETDAATVDGEIRYDTIPCNFWYIAYLDPNDADFLAIAIKGQDGTNVVAICANHEAEARAELEKLLLVLD